MRKRSTVRRTHLSSNFVEDGGIENCHEDGWHHNRPEEDEDQIVGIRHFNEEASLLRWTTSMPSEQRQETDHGRQTPTDEYGRSRPAVGHRYGVGERFHDGPESVDRNGHEGKDGRGAEQHQHGRHQETEVEVSR